MRGPPGSALLAVVLVFTLLLVAYHQTDHPQPAGLRRALGKKKKKPVDCSAYTKDKHCTKKSKGACAWEGGTCMAATCLNQESRKSCLKFSVGDLACAWDGGACQAATCLHQASRKSCLKFSVGDLACEWRGSKKKGSCARTGRTPQAVTKQCARGLVVLTGSMRVG